MLSLQRCIELLGGDAPADLASVEQVRAVLYRVWRKRQRAYFWRTETFRPLWNRHLLNQHSPSWQKMIEPRSRSARPSSSLTATSRGTKPSASPCTPSSIDREPNAVATSKNGSAVIYCRVSTAEQVQNLSLSTQEKLCREYCGQQGWDVARVFIEQGESAKTANRPELQNLLTYCREHKRGLAAVVVYALNRFSRDSKDHHILRGLLLGFGIAIRSATEPIDESSTGRLMEGLLAAFAQYDNDVRAERTTAGMKEAITRGRWTFQAPIGYRNGHGHRSEPSLVPDDNQGPLVAQAFELYATGLGKIECLRAVTALGLTSSSGRPVTPQTFDRMIRNPVYSGRIIVPRWKLNVRGDFQPLVTDLVFQQVQRRLRGGVGAGKARTKLHQDFPLRRFVRCTHCETPLTGSWSTGRNRKYPYYHCRRCRRVTLKKADLEARFTSLLEELIPKPGFVRLFREIVIDVWKGELIRAEAIRSALDKRIEEFSHRLLQLDEAFVFQKAIDRESYESQRDRIREQRALAELERSQVEVEQIDVEGILTFAEHTLSNATALWNQASVEAKQDIQRALFPKGLDFDGSEFGTVVTCLAFSQLQDYNVPNNQVASPTGFEPVFRP